MSDRPRKRPRFKHVDHVFITTFCVNCGGDELDLALYGTPHCPQTTILSTALSVDGKPLTDMQPTR